MMWYSVHMTEKELMTEIKVGALIIGGMIVFCAAMGWL